MANLHLQYRQANATLLSTFTITCFRLRHPLDNLMLLTNHLFRKGKMEEKATPHIHVPAEKRSQPFQLQSPNAKSDKHMLILIPEFCFELKLDSFNF